MDTPLALYTRIQTRKTFQTKNAMQETFTWEKRKLGDRTVLRKFKFPQFYTKFDTDLNMMSRVKIRK